MTRIFIPIFIFSLITSLFPAASHAQRVTLVEQVAGTYHLERCEHCPIAVEQVAIKLDGQICLERYCFPLQADDSGHFSFHATVTEEMGLSFAEVVTFVQGMVTADGVMSLVTIAYEPLPETDIWRWRHGWAQLRRLRHPPPSDDP